MNHTKPTARTGEVAEKKSVPVTLRALIEKLKSNGEESMLDEPISFLVSDGNNNVAWIHWENLDWWNLPRREGQLGIRVDLHTHRLVRKGGVK